MVIGYFQRSTGWVAAVKGLARVWVGQPMLMGQAAFAAIALGSPQSDHCRVAGVQSVPLHLLGSTLAGTQRPL
jgi:hypothetical protein